MKKTTIIRDFYSRIIGYIETDDQGNKVVKDFYRRTLGKYDAKADVTRDFYNRIISKGDITASLLTRNNK